MGRGENAAEQGNLQVGGVREGRKGFGRVRLPLSQPIWGLKRLGVAVFLSKASSYALFI